MSKTVSQVKDSVAALLTGVNLNSISSVNTALERAARILVGKCYIPDVMGTSAVTLYDGVYDYTAPTSIYGTNLIDIAPQGNTRTFLDYAYKQPLADFDREKGLLPSGYAATFKYKNGTGYVRITSPRPTPRASLDTMTDDSGWANGGSAGAITEDRTVFYENPASLRFTVTGASVGTLTKTVSQQDLSDYEDVGVAFLAIYVPTSVANLTSVALRIGSSASAYDEVTKTTGFLGAWVADSWLLVAFDFSGSTSTGTPDWNAIDYVQVRVTHGATITNFRVGGLWISLPSPADIIYQTDAFFLTSGGSPSSSIANDNDTVTLNNASIVLYEHECAKTIALQESGGAYTLQIKGFDEVLEALYDTYRANNPSDVLRNTGSYYE